MGSCSFLVLQMLWPALNDAIEKLNRYLTRLTNIPQHRLASISWCLRERKLNVPQSNCISGRLWCSQLYEVVFVTMIVCFDGSLNNHDNYGGENLKKALKNERTNYWIIMNKTTALHVHHTFCYIYKSSAPDSDKDVNFLTRRSIRRKWTLDDEFSFLYFNFYEINCRKIRLHLTNWGRLKFEWT